MNSMQTNKSMAHYSATDHIKANNYSNLVNVMNAASSTSPAALIPDENLASKLREAFNLSDGESITVAHLESLITFAANNSGITSIQGLELAINLVTLSLANNKIENLDISSGNYQKLKELSLDNNLITDVSPLSHLPELTYLAINGNKITDISPINTIPTLTILGADNNQISDISSLSSLVNMQQFSFVNNNISDISVIKNYQYLIGVFFSDNPLASIEPLRDRKTLEIAVLNNIGISDFSVLTERDSLARVEISNNKVTDITFLKNSKDTLLRFVASYNDITDISVLTNAAKLVLASIDYNQHLKNMAPLKNAPNLLSLSISGTSIDDLSGISQALIELFISFNHIADYSLLANFDALRLLSVEESGIEDISFINSIKNISSVYINGNKITDMSALNASRGVYIYADNQFITLNETPLGSPTTITIANADNATLNINWLTSGWYNPSKKQLQWDNTGINSLSWMTPSITFISFSGQLSQRVY